MTDTEIIRSQVLQGENDGLNDPTSGFYRSTVVLCVTLCIVLLLLVAQSDRLQVVSDFGIPVQLSQMHCPEPEAHTSACFLLTSGQVLTVAPGAQISLRLLAAGRSTTPLAQFIVMEPSGRFWHVKSGSPIAGLDDSGSMRASLVIGQRTTSPITIVLDGWRRLLGG